MSKRSWYIKGGRVVDPASGRDETADILILNGMIASPLTQAAAGLPVIDARGSVVTPGFMDVHVHLREPGDEAAETIASGSAAAARGGFTSIVAMPNTRPATDSPRIVADVRRRGEQAGRVRVMPAGCITTARRGEELADLAGMAAAGAVAFTDDGNTVADEALMLRAMARARDLGLPIFDHAQDPAIGADGVMHEGSFSRRQGIPGMPSAAETAIVERDIRLAETTGCAVHIQHVSTLESVELIRRARRRGLRISGEATPHHLALTEADVDVRDARFKMNPPLRAEADRRAVVAGVADGTLQVLATDHAPHVKAAKELAFSEAPFGVVGLETAVGVSYTQLVKSGSIGLSDWVARWTTGPADALGRALPSLAVGRVADLVVLDLESDWVVRAEEFLSKSRNTPFEGRRLTGRAVMTFLGGVVSWDGRQKRGF